MLTQAQVDHYRTFGFVTLPGYLSREELAAITSEFEFCVNEAYSDRPFDGSARHWVPLLTDKAPTFSILAEGRMLEAAEALLGKDVVMLMADGNRYVGETPWHADMGAELQGAKMVAYLDPVAADSGALRVIPGSHQEPLHSAVRRYMEAHVHPQEPQPTAALPATALVSEPGDVVVFNPPAWHASVGGGVDRRMCTWDYFQLPPEGEDCAHIRDFTAGLVKLTEQIWPEKSYPFYDPAWIDNSRDNPARRQMVERMRRAGLFSAAGLSA